MFSRLPSEPVELPPLPGSIPPDSGEAACHLEGGVRPRPVPEVDYQRIGRVVQGVRDSAVVDDRSAARGRGWRRGSAWVAAEMRLRVWGAGLQ